MNLVKVHNKELPKKLKLKWDVFVLDLLKPCMLCNNEALLKFNLDISEISFTCVEAQILSKLVLSGKDELDKNFLDKAIVCNEYDKLGLYKL